MLNKNQQVFYAQVNERTITRVLFPHQHIILAAQLESPQENKVPSFDWTVGIKCANFPAVENKPHAQKTTNDPTLLCCQC
jgi:hypothetical protein